MINLTRKKLQRERAARIEALINQFKRDGDDMTPAVIERVTKLLAHFDELSERLTKEPAGVAEIAAMADLMQRVLALMGANDAIELAERTKQLGSDEK